MLSCNFSRENSGEFATCLGSAYFQLSPGPVNYRWKKKYYCQGLIIRQPTETVELGRQQKANAFCAGFLGCVNRAARAEGWHLHCCITGELGHVGGSKDPAK